MSEPSRNAVTVSSTPPTSSSTLTAEQAGGSETTSTGTAGVILSKRGRRFVLVLTDLLDNPIDGGDDWN